MNLRLTKPWIELTAENVAKLPGQLGIYQIGEPDGSIVYIGFAGGRTLFGLRSELESWLKLRAGKPARFRYEVNMQYTTRHQELLMLHVAEHGGVPVANTDVDPRRLGRLSPA